MSFGALAGGKPSTAKSWESGTTPRTNLWEGIAGRLGVSVSFLFLGQPKTPEDYDFIAKYADEIAGAEALLSRRQPSRETNYDRLKSGEKTHQVREDAAATHAQVASRIPLQRAPSTRVDCEDYVLQLFNAAEMSDDPNKWPVIHDRLKKKFPLDEWKNEPEKDPP